MRGSTYGWKLISGKTFFSLLLLTIFSEAISPFRSYVLDAEVDKYKARIWTNSSVLITIPAWDYTIYRKRDQLERAMSENKSCRDHLIHSLDNALHEDQEKYGQFTSKNILI